MALYTGGPPAHPAAARVRRRRALAPAAARRALRRRPHGVVPVLLAAGRGAGAAAAPLRPRRRLARGLEPRLLARVPRACRRARRAGRAGALRCACRSGRSASRACIATACARAACAATSTVLEGEYAGDARRRREPRPRRAGRRVRRAAHPREASAGARARRRAGARATARSCARRSTATAPSAPRCCERDRASTGSTGSSRRRGSSTPTRSDAALAAGALHGAAVASARATGWSWSRRPRAARPSVVVRGARQRGGRAGRRGRERRSSPRRPRRRTWPRRSCACTREGLALRERTCDWFARNARAAVARGVARARGAHLRAARLAARGLPRAKLPRRPRTRTAPRSWSAVPRPGRPARRPRLWRRRVHRRGRPGGRGGPDRGRGVRRLARRRSARTPGSRCSWPTSAERLPIDDAQRRRRALEPGDRAPARHRPLHGGDPSRPQARTATPWSPPTTSPSWHNIVSLVMGWQPFPSHVSDSVYVGNPLNFAPGPTGMGSMPGQTHQRVFTGRALAELGRHHGLEPELQGAAGYYPLPPRAGPVAARWDPRHGAFLVHRFRRRRPSRERAAVGRRASARRSRSQVNAAARARPGRAQPLGAPPRRRAAARSPRAIASTSSGSNSSAASPATSASDARPEHGHRHAARHRLEHRQPEALVQRREHEQVAARVQPLELGAVDPAAEAHVGRRRRASRAQLAQLGLVRRRIAGERPARGRRSAGCRASASSSRGEVLVRPLGRHATARTGRSPSPSRSRSSASGVGARAAAARRRAARRRSCPPARRRSRDQVVRASTAASTTIRSRAPRGRRARARACPARARRSARPGPCGS